MNLTTLEVAKLLGVSVSYVDRLIRNGKIHGVRFGPVWAITEDSVKEYQNSPKRPAGRPKKIKPPQ